MKKVKKIITPLISGLACICIASSPLLVSCSSNNEPKVNQSIFIVGVTQTIQI